MSREEVVSRLRLPIRYFSDATNSRKLSFTSVELRFSGFGDSLCLHSHKYSRSGPEITRSSKTSTFRVLFSFNIGEGKTSKPSVSRGRSKTFKSFGEVLR